MSFLSSLFLIALPLAAVPVLIHLYRGRQRDMVYWGAMQFLEKALTKGRSWERIEELVLMFVRTAVVLALIFALARPLISSSWWGSAAGREIVLVLDDSLSMSRAIGDVSAFDKLKDNAIALLDEVSDGDVVHVMLAAGGGRWLTAEGIDGDFAGVSQIRSLIEGSEPTRGTANLLTCVLSVVHLDLAEKSTSRRIVVLTDNQLHGWQIEAEQAWKQLEETISAAAVPTTVQVVDCGIEGEPIENLAVNSIDLSRKIVQPGEKIEVRAEIANLGDNECDGISIEWLVDDDVVEKTHVGGISPGATAQVTATLRREDPGAYLISCRIAANDQVPLDQDAGIVVEVTDEVPILIVHNPDPESSERSAADFICAALGHDGRAPLPWHTVYSPTLIGPEQLADSNLLQYRAVILTDFIEGDDDTLAYLQSFLREGGGLWLALGENVDRDVFNRDFFDDGDGICPLPLDSLQEHNMSAEEGGLIHPPSGDHPATSQLANTTQLDIDQARIFTHWRFAPREGDASDAKVLLEAGDGTPLAVESYVGPGRVIVQSFPLGLQWSNLPQLKAYVVMVSDWLDYLTAPSSARFNLTPGSALTAVLPDSVDESSIKLLTPAGSVNELVVQAGASPTVRFWQTHLPGCYRLMYDQSGVSASMPFSVERSPEESILVFADEDHRQFMVSSGVIFGSQISEYTTNEESSIVQEPLWQFLLVALIGSLAVELLLSSWLTRQRSGPLPGTSM